ncbi:post-segregation antitoxin CcdA [Methylobacter tundripaludum]|jgi:Post-segregation antitoxin CcdA.|uniref:Post-segregation antitoxin CcdA n=1 Tax=Methylobacter tundripaludum TaxID=173365 RepID=A0A2S6HIG8_9GAMM|nr:type II toxin-antitoxin system CcdA family antitoxin [Methylobacter tundripaludum]PPK77236.1 post-segregation antitoxin CcdA [Methylobacter tundripaludum]
MMQPFVNTTKKATNISQSCDQFLRELHEQLWLQDNADFIAAYNQTVADEGLPLDSWRSF